MNYLFQKKKKYLYLITPPNLLKKELLLDEFLIVLNKVLKTKKIKFLQLRLKNKSEKKIIKISKKINVLCKKYNTLFFINDYVSEKILKFCDGVHLGQKDLSKKKINLIHKKKKYLGITCHNSEKFVKKVMHYKPNYISFGSFFNTETKKIKFLAKIKNINWFKKNFSIPCAAIGGINIKNCKKILNTECNLLAICSGIWNFEEGPIKAVNKFYKILKEKK